MQWLYRALKHSIMTGAKNQSKTEEKNIKKA
jgi:hypothetical protein